MDGITKEEENVLIGKLVDKSAFYTYLSLISFILSVGFSAIIYERCYGFLDEWKTNWVCTLFFICILIFFVLGIICVYVAEKTRARIHIMLGDYP